MAHEDEPVGRRAFFRQGLRGLFRPFDLAVAPLERAIRELGNLDPQFKEAPTPAPQAVPPGPQPSSTVPLASPRAAPPGAVPLASPGAVPLAPPFAPPHSVPLELWHRPPGVYSEMQFRETCSRCGECVKVCPAQCIKIDPQGIKGAGFPRIDVDAMPCVVCEGLQCMHVCPTGALLPTPLGDIDMGTAEWQPDTCVRSHGQDCMICVDRCPLGTAAIELKDGKIHVIEDGCIGCGVCQYYCPTSPKSIVVMPRADRI